MTKLIQSFLIIGLLFQTAWSGDVLISNLSPSHQQAFQIFTHNFKALENHPELIQQAVSSSLKNDVENLFDSQEHHAELLQLKLKLAELQTKKDQTAQYIENLKTALDAFRLPIDSPTETTTEISKDNNRHEDLYNTQVKPIFDSKCLICHDGNRAKAGFDITTSEALLRGGKNGKAIIPGNAEESLLYQMIAYQHEPYMPFKLPKLKDEEIALIKKWIDAGALTPQPDEKLTSTLSIKEITDEERQFWSFQPLKKIESKKS